MIDPANASTVQANARRRRLWLHVLRVLWVVAAVLSVQILLLGIPPAYTQLSTLCVEQDCPSYRIVPQGMAALEDLGWTLHGYAVYNIVLVVITTLIALGVSVVIFRSRPRDPMALYTAVTLLLVVSFLGEYGDVLPLVHPAFEAIAAVGYLLTLFMFVGLFYIFPDGRFVPRWSKWVFLAWFAVPIIAISLVFADLLDAYLPYGVLLTGPLLLTCVVAPIIRYRRADPMERQQLKWTLFGLIQLAAVMILLVEVGPLVFPALDMAGTLANAVGSLIEMISLSLLSVSIGFAVLRYRLWEVNLLLNRTLVYVPLTSILAVVYAITLRVSEKLFVSVAGEQPQAVAVFTTVVLTTTFSPIRNMLQSGVDRYFKEPPDPLKPLRQLEKDVTEVVSVLHHPQVLQRMVEHAVAATQASGGALYLTGEEGERLAFATADFDANSQATPVCLNLVQDAQADAGETRGRLVLGPRRDGTAHDDAVCAVVQASSARILQNLHLVSELHNRRSRA